eukprot:scaffold31556_cov62-Attheya_sp.AAC.6
MSCTTFVYINSGWQNSVGETTMLSSTLKAPDEPQSFKMYNIGFMYRFECPYQTSKLFHPERDSGKFETLWGNEQVRARATHIRIMNE